jgi:hypothetical protein
VHVSVTEPEVTGLLFASFTVTVIVKLAPAFTGLGASTWIVALEPGVMVIVAVPLSPPLTAVIVQVPAVARRLVETEPTPFVNVTDGSATDCSFIIAVIVASPWNVVAVLPLASCAVTVMLKLCPTV